ncbi:DUF4169 family protein [Actibacterium sp. XHP0104]|uniref:DUF4169 family protein n=1 Tax=Actibacterium sp. XHP0104 TaxID=2984335 RepID=UPI0021E7A3A3|nr:DUF4169 family protein [Actibacterium sp. XHP0104]MCV2880938.1 DUF4169 family protein [Actibacterium sp. XHP0104]
MNAKIINLNQFRKQATRDTKRAEADVNAVKYGRTKMEKALEKLRNDKAERDLDGHLKE